MKTLSIFCDESGDFGSFAEHSPYYIVSFVLHDQSNEIKEQIKHLENSIQYYGLSSKHAIHSAPLIRREGAYASLDAVSRKKIWDKLFTFFLKCPVLYFSILVEKREAGGGDDLADAIARQLTSVLRSKNDYISNFDKVNIYYDKGQKEITRILRVVFSTRPIDFDFRVVRPEDYHLFQVADLACTMTLLQKKIQGGCGLSNSEIDFFGSTKRFKKTYLKQFLKKQML